MLRILVRRVGSAATVCLAVALLAACGGPSPSSSATTPPANSTSTPSTSSTSSPSPSGTVQVSTAAISGLGTVLVNGQGLTLYMFVPDNDSHVTCTGACAQVWPPLKIGAGQSAVASGQAKSTLIGSDPDPAGGRVVTYAGWPLYTYVADTSPGMATGQAINLNGGLWYVLSPSGQVIKTKPNS